MYNTQPKKKDDMVLVIRLDQTKIISGHIAIPKGGRHKDKRRLAKVTQRSLLRRES
jgi:hypothetical protein